MDYVGYSEGVTMNQKLQIKQIAEMAGVSVATISRVINNKGGYSAETEKKVLKVIKDNNYFPNQVAKGLRTNNTNVIGLIVPDIVNEYFAKMVLSIQMELFKVGYLTVVCNVNENDKLEYELVNSLITQNVSGIILISGRANMKTNGIPTIYVDRHPIEDALENNFVIIESDNVHGGYLATCELISSGCKKIAFITDCIGESSKKSRYKGYKKALSENNIDINYQMLLQVKNVTIDDSYKEVTKAIDNNLDVDGIVCTTDIIAIGAILALKDRGKKVPEDIKITGFDNISMTKLFEPSITTVNQFHKNIAKEVSHLILELIAGKSIEEKHRIIPIELIKRKSSKKGLH